jgi:large subunit ribosomal protein L30e
MDNMSIDEIKKSLKSENMVIGADKVLKALRKKELEKIFLASNAPAALMSDVKRFAELTGTQLELLAVPNDELGVVCKKPFSISTIGLKKATEKKKH